jgi:hypothetical protein
VTACRKELVQSVSTIMKELSKDDIQGIWCESMRKWIQTMTYGHA